MANNDPFRIANAHLDLWNNRNFNPLRDLLAPNATMRYLWENNDRNAEQSLDDFDNTWHNAFPNVRWNIDNIIWNDNTITLEWNANGTNTGRFMDNNASGRNCTWRGANVIQLDDNGRITRENIYTDMSNILWQMGVNNHCDANNIRDTANNMINAFNRRDDTWMNDHTTDDFNVTMPDNNNMNRDDYQNFLLRIVANMPDATCNTNQMNIRNNQVMLTGNIHGTMRNNRNDNNSPDRHNDPSNNNNNQQINVDFCWVMTFRNDRICQINQYNDNTQLVNSGMNPNRTNRMANRT